MPKKAADKDLVTVGVPRLIHGAASEWCERKRFSLRDLIDGTLRWFLEQDEPIQRAILGDVDKGMERYYIDVLRRKADELEAKARRPRHGRIGNEHVTLGE